MTPERRNPARALRAPSDLHRHHNADELAVNVRGVRGRARKHLPAHQYAQVNVIFHCYVRGGARVGVRGVRGCAAVPIGAAHPYTPARTPTRRTPTAVDEGSCAVT